MEEEAFEVDLERWGKGLRDSMRHEGVLGT